MTDHILASLKAYAALVGSVLTAVVGMLTPDDPLYRWVTLAIAVCTALTVYVVPNADAEDENGFDHP